jgi:hypothetical protein
MWCLSILIIGLLAMGMAADCARAETSKSGLMGKVGSNLAVLYDEYKASLAPGGGGVPTFRNPLMRISDGLVVIAAVASGDVRALQADLEALGMQGAMVAGRIVSGQLPILAIDALAGLASLQFAQPAYASTHVGPLSPGAQQVPTLPPAHK